MSEKKWLVPDVIEPIEKVCVQLEIPNDVKHIAAFWGALEQLNKAYNWEDSYGDGSQTAYVWRDVIADASEKVQIGENCMIDCDEVEACLPTAPTIINIDNAIDLNETNIATNETDIATNETDITNLFDNPQDGNFYDPPQPDSETDLACQISGYMVDELSTFIALVDTYGAEPDVLTALFAALNGDYFYTLHILILVLRNFIIGGALPLAPDFDTQKSQLHEYMYCENDFDKASVAAWVIANLTRGQEIGDEILCVALSVWQQWQTLGEFATGYDCSSFACSEWCHRFDFTLGLDGWTLVHGTQEAGGIRNVNYEVGPVHYSASWVSLDLAPYSNIVSMRAVAHAVTTSIESTVIFWWLDHDGAGTGSVVEIHPPGWNGDGEARDTVIDVSDWDDIFVALHVAVRSDGPFGGTPEGYLDYIEFTGTGVNPFTDNCP